MPVSDRAFRREGCLLLGVAAGIAGLVAGCGDGDSSKPASINVEQQKQVQQHLGKGYRDQLIAEAKSQAEAKAKANNAKKKSP